MPGKGGHTRLPGVHDLQANSREQGGRSQAYLRERQPFSAKNTTKRVKLESSTSQKGQTGQCAWSERGILWTGAELKGAGQATRPRVPAREPGPSLEAEKLEEFLAGKWHDLICILGGSLRLQSGG